MNHDEHRQLQHDLVDKMLTILRDDERVLGVLMVGSYARGRNDAFSDLDVGCYLRDEQRTGWWELYEQVGEVAPLLSRLWLYDVHALYLFENGVRLDLDFYRPSQADVAWRSRSQTLILYDLDRFLADRLTYGDLAPQAEHPQGWQPGDATYVEWYLWMFRQIVCWSKRADQGGRRSFTKLSNAADSLHQVRAGLTSMRLWTLGEEDCLAHVDPDCAERLAASYPHLDAWQIIACTHVLLDEYARICPDYCAKAGISYPAHKVAVLRELLADYEALE